MKSVELQLNKRLLIVEYPNDKSFQDDLSFYSQFKIGGFEQYIVEFICKGSDLTEDIANGLIERKKVFDTPEVYFFKNYKYEFSDCLTALQSFISAIESKGFTWGDNSKAINNYCPGADPTIVNIYQNKVKSRTFHPEKCIILEIV